MAPGFGKKLHIDAKVASPPSHQVRGWQQRELLPPLMRSPVLEPLQRAKAGRQAGRMSRHSATPSRKMSYAAEETLVRPASSRKSLPRLKAANADRESYRRTAQRSGERRQVLWAAAQRDVSVQVISEEERKKLADLDLNMRLTRVAGKIDGWLLIIVLALLCGGLVMVYSASSFVAVRSANGDASYFFQRQLLSVVIGLMVMFVTMNVDYRYWRKFSLLGMLVVLPLLVGVLKFGYTAFGASRWLGFGTFFLFQPSELAKLVLALYIADWLARKGNQVSTFIYGLAPFVILVGVVLGLVLLENDMGTAVIIAGFATAMFFSAGANIVQFLLAILCGGLIFVREAFNGYRLQRLIGFIDPFKHITDINLQLYQSLLGLGSGGLFGLGLGASRQKTGYLPFPFTDSIFAILGEELGFIGCAVVMLLFAFLAFRGFRLARRTQDIYGALLATGITTWLILQILINVGASTASIPYTGVPLPFISFGGSSLVVSLAAVGVLLNISRYMQTPEDPALPQHGITLHIRKMKSHPEL